VTDPLAANDQEAGEIHMSGCDIGPLDFEEKLTGSCLVILYHPWITLKFIPAGHMAF
jgi:hypothetical protein